MKNRRSYFHYFTYGFPDLADQALLRVRKQSFDCFISEFAPRKGDSILDVGVSPDDHGASNYFEKHYPHRENITAVSEQEIPEATSQFPGMRFVQASGLDLPFGDGEFDFVHSHAVIEHVGSRSNQERFIRELSRVARLGVMISTPNRWHPFEFHTGLPLIHYLPASFHRRVFRVVGQSRYAQEEDLHLLGRGELLELCARAGRSAQSKIVPIHWLGFCSNLLLLIRTGMGRG